MSGCGLRFAAYLALGIALVASHAVAQQGVDRARQNGIDAQLSTSAEKASVAWRLDTDTAPTIEATWNGRSLEPSRVQPYPLAGQASAIVALLDITDPRRQEQIDWFKSAMIVTATRAASHDKMCFAIFGLEGSVLAPQATDPAEFVSLLRDLPPLDEKANLTGALISAVHTLALLPAERRGVFVFSDGHNDGTVALDQVAEFAQKVGVALTFVIAPSPRPRDQAALERAAKLTGGQVIGQASFDSFFARPFAVLDSGGSAEFTLRRYYWEPQSALLAVTLTAAGQSVTLQHATEIAAADLREHLAFLFSGERARISIAALAGLLVLIVVGGCLLIRRRQRRNPKAAPVTPTTATPAGRVAMPGATAGALPAASAVPDGPERIPSCEEMWERLKLHLRSRLPRDHERLTAMEIANTVGDEKLRQFVRAYYYPRVYGREPGQLTDAAAFALMKSIAG